LKRKRRRERVSKMREATKEKRPEDKRKKKNQCGVLQKMKKKS
jgi:hypothetical protein